MNNIHCILFIGKENSVMKYECICGYIYNEETGEPGVDIAPGTIWADVPDSFECPVCGMGKDSFTEV